MTKHSSSWFALILEPLYPTDGQGRDLCISKTRQNLVFGERKARLYFLQSILRRITGLINCFVATN